VALAGLLLGGSLFTAASRPAPPAPNRNWRSFSSPISPSLPMWFPSIAVIRPASSARSAAIPRTNAGKQGLAGATRARGGWGLRAEKQCGQSARKRPGVRCRTAGDL